MEQEKEQQRLGTQELQHAGGTSPCSHSGYPDVTMADEEDEDEKTDISDYEESNGNITFPAAVSEFPDVKIKVEKEEEPWIMIHQSFDETSASSNANSVGFSIPKPESSPETEEEGESSTSWRKIKNENEDLEQNTVGFSIPKPESSPETEEEEESSTSSQRIKNENKDIEQNTGYPDIVVKMEEMEQEFPPTQGSEDMEAVCLVLMAPEKEKKKIISIQLKKDIIRMHDRGMRVTELAAAYNMAKSTISSILKKKNILKGIDVAKGVTILTKIRTPLIEKVEKLLLVWMNEKQLKGESINEAMIRAKAKKLHTDLMERNPSGSALQEKFKASRGWFQKFQKRSGIHCVTRHGEAASSDRDAAEAFKFNFTKFVKEEEYLPQQVFNCDETRLFWKKMPRRTFLTQEELKTPGHRPMKDRLTLLLCANAAGDLKIKPLLVYHCQTPRPFLRERVNKATLPVMWRANARAWMTRQLFMEWFYEVFAPTVKRYLSDNQLPERCLLLMDNAPAHPPSLMDGLDNEYHFIRVRFLPPNTTPFLQPMNQQVTNSFKKLYTKALFTRCFNVIEETSLTLREFWKEHFNVLHCIRLIDKAWQDVATQTLNSAWKKLWPECAADDDAEWIDAQVVRDIVSMGEGMGLDVNEKDIEELVEDHEKELTTEELEVLEAEQQKALVEELPADEEEVGAQISSEEISYICQKWNECQEFFERHHPNRTVTGRVLDMMNDNVVSYFRKILQRRFVTRMEPVAKRQQQETPGEDDPKEGGSTSL
nr:tigger transposable element-derived protein 1-like isoform X5 [Pogona vitticeps]